MCLYQTLINQFYTISDVSKHYKKSQLSNLEEFINYCELNNLKVESVSSGDANDYLEYLKNKVSRLGYTLANNTINQNLNAINLLYNELIKIDKIKSNPFSTIRRLPVDKITNAYGSNVLTIQEVKDLFNTCETIREKVILHLFYSAGLRRSEAERMKIQHVDFRKNQIIVEKGKGNKSRIVPVSEKVMNDFKEYVFTEREELLGDRVSNYLIISKNSLQTKGGSMYRVVRKIANETLNKVVVPHQLRATYATHCIDNGMNPDSV